MENETKPQPETLSAAISDLGLSVHASFVPWSESRSAKPRPTFEDYNLNWRVTLRHNGRDVVVTDYSAGMGYCPSYKPMARKTIDYVDAIKAECQTGRRQTDSKGNVLPPWKRSGTGPTIAPDSVSVVYSLVSDSDVLNYGTFEQWAEDFGYDVDSRSAEATYRACLTIALQLQSAIGAANLARLREASQDY
jgi:hypothetical protein